MKDKDLDLLLKKALSKEFEPDSDLNTNIYQKVREKEMKMEIKNSSKIRKLSIAAAICCVLLCGSVTVFAALRFLTPKEVAVEYGNDKLAAAFDSDDAIVMNTSQAYDAYTVTLLGTVSGKNLTDIYSDGQLIEDRTYAVVAISKTDGSPMPKTSDEEYGNVPFFVSPLIQGLNPQQYNIMTMNGGYYEIVRDGIMYRIIECDNIQLFADRALYLCVCNSTFYEKDAYVYNEQTGDITRNESYNGMNLLFDLPLDKSKANKELAEKYLSEFAFTNESRVEEKSNESVETVEKAETVEDTNIDEIISNWKLIKEEKVKPDEDGRIYSSYETKNGSGKGFITEEALFEEGEVGYSKNVTLEGNEDSKYATIYYRDNNGDVTVSIYEKGNSSLLKPTETK